MADSLRDLLKHSGLEIAKMCNNQCIEIVDMHDYLKGKKITFFSIYVAVHNRPR